MSLRNQSFVLHEPYKTKFEERPVPEIEDPYDVIVKVKYTGICGSDVHYWTDGKIGDFVLKKPMVLGHESSGIVHSVGSEASKTHAKGDAVALEPQIPCRRCSSCKSGRYNLCPDIKFAATPPIDGTLARYYRLPVDFCHKLPQGMKLEHGALCEPASVAVHACREAGVGVGSKVVVFGAGPVGLLACGVAKVMGAAQIVAVDVVDERLEFAKKYASAETFKTRKDELVEDSAVRLKEECELGDGADAVIEATGAQPCIRIGCHVLRGKGTFCQIGLGSPDISLPIGVVGSKELVIRGMFRYGPGDYAQAISLISSGKLEVDTLITRRVKFEDAEEAFKDVKAGKGIKLIIEGPTA